MAKSAWKKFPYADKAYDYDGAKLKKAWDKLHRGDREPFPDAAWVEKIVAAHPKLDPKMPATKAADALQAAWRAYHAGDFGAAVEQGEALGPIGSCVANKAANIYATYLETDDRRQLEIFQQSAARAESCSRSPATGRTPSTSTPPRLAATASSSPSPRRWPRDSARR